MHQRRIKKSPWRLISIKLAYGLNYASFRCQVIYTVNAQYKKRTIEKLYLSVKLEHLRYFDLS